MFQLFHGNVLIATNYYGNPRGNDGLNAWADAYASCFILSEGLYMTLPDDYLI